LIINCIIGLGNPDEDYLSTRHNVGFMVLDELAKRHKKAFKPGKGSFYFAKFSEIILVKPTTYMNRSGAAALKISENEGIPPENFLAVLDDFELPLGQIRVRKNGSAGSHNGLASLVEKFGTEDFPRVRIGIGPLPEHADAADFVLSPFKPEEVKLLPEIISRAADAVETAVFKGIEKAMNRFNMKIKTEDKNPSDERKTL
jgi:peptidyl-tRNA hydrolase, PTH1 family